MSLIRAATLLVRFPFFTTLLVLGCGDSNGGSRVLDGADVGAGGEAGLGGASGGTGGSAGSGGAPPDADLPMGTGPFCELLREVLLPTCTQCHKPGGNAPDMTADAAANLVGMASVVDPDRPLVAPGDPEGSLLFRRVSGTQAPDEGGVMPPQGQLPAAQLEVVRAWIAAGAPTTCDVEVPQPDGGAPPFHPPGFDAPAVHGLEMKTGLQDCRDCHGDTLEGAAGPSCDSCHQMGWRTNCTYCHGGTDSMTGAPPRDLRGATAAEELSFRAHTQHTTERNHIAWDCDQCHTKPMDVLSPGHVFDDTAGAAEVDFSGGLSERGSYRGAGACGNLYCHGNGRILGAFGHEEPRPTCDGCHSRGRLGGHHGEHLREGLACTECHNATVTAQGTIADLSRHVNGEVDVVFAVAGFSRGAAGCTGVCHGERHQGRRW